MVNTVSGFIYYKTAEIKEIHFEYIIYNGKTTILNDDPNNNTNYMITIDASSQILENVENIYEKIIGKSNIDNKDVLDAERNKLFKKLRNIKSVEDLFNLKNNEQGKPLTTLIKENKKLKKQLNNNAKVKNPNDLPTSKKILDNILEITRLLESNKDSYTIIMKLFFILKTYNKQFNKMFNNCHNIDDITKCFDNIKIDPQRIIFFLLKFDNDNNINKIYINNHNSEQNKNSIINNGYIYDIDNILKDVDYNIIYKLIFIKDKLYP